MFAVLLSLLAACSNTQPALSRNVVTPALVAEAKAPKELLGINSVLIAEPTYDARARALEQSRSRVISELQQAAREQADMQIVDNPDSRTALASVEGDDRARLVAKKFGADAILQTTILRFVERQGSAVGATQPAGVDFSMRLVRSSDGKVVWSASYHFQDAFLSENLFKAQQRFSPEAGAGWRSAGDLLAEGFRSAFNQLSTQRIEQFSSEKARG